MRRLLPFAAALFALAACSTDHAALPLPAPAPPSAASTSDSTSTSAAAPALDDYNGDGTPDPLCATQDFGGGLVLKIPCSIGTAHEPEEGTRLVKDSLYRLPGVDIDLTGISAEMIFARAANTDERVFILVFNSDNLFATGHAELNAPDQLDRAIAVLNAKLPGGAVQVRGHTDSTGDAAGNQTLSVQRATTVQQYLTAHGLKASRVDAVGFGRTRPLVEETNPDGSVSLKGRAFNRRVEIAIRLPRS
ncbi:OmpA family protein [Dactylosporangium sp. CS-033363]|uniref:OmpA family protein n=1 Tax=Dactylosporangium sp. CS-033363 TaxID=3239935 RepID=UPI003D8DE0FB